MGTTVEAVSSPIQKRTASSNGTILSKTMTLLRIIPVFLSVTLFNQSATALTAWDRIKDCDICPEVVVVPAGTYFIGSKPDETLREEMHKDGDTAAGPGEDGQSIVTVTLPEVARRERPRTRIVIPAPFAIGRTEVTLDQFAAFVAATGYQATKTCRVYNDAGSFFYDAEDVTWKEPGFTQSGDHPVVCITWRDATAYADWLTKYTGAVYRLPTEAEWEYAARAGSDTARPWGDGTAESCDFANVGDLDMADKFGWTNREFVCRDGYAATSPVASFHPNAWGLYDVLGNAWEIIEDCWHETHQGRPTDATAWRGEACTTLRMTKGASWSHFPWGTRSAVRNRTGIDAAYYTTGVRIIREVSE